MPTEALRHAFCPASYGDSGRLKQTAERSGAMTLHPLVKHTREFRLIITALDFSIWVRNEIDSSDSLA